MTWRLVSEVRILGWTLHFRSGARPQRPSRLSFKPYPREGAQSDSSLLADSSREEANLGLHKLLEAHHKVWGALQATPSRLGDPNLQEKQA